MTLKICGRRWEWQMRALLSVVGFAAMLGSAPALASDMKFACSRGDTVRTVAVVTSPASGRACEVQYEKTSQGDPAQVLWHADSDSAFCASQAKALVDRLKEAGWSCSADAANTADAAPPPAEAAKPMRVSTSAASKMPAPMPIASALEVSEPAPEGLTGATKAQPRMMPQGDRAPIDPGSLPKAGAGAMPTTTPAAAGAFQLRPTIH
jgi:hypothetical protein